LDRHVGHRASILLALAVVDVVYAITLWTSDPDATAIYRWFDAVVPLWLWGFAWVSVAVVCAVAAFRQDDTIGFQAACTIKVFWGLGSLAGNFLSDVPPSSTVIWFAFAFVAWRIAGWPEPPKISEDHGRDNRTP
jgi:hypothetical protein